MSLLLNLIHLLRHGRRVGLFPLDVVADRPILPPFFHSTLFLPGPSSRYTASLDPLGGENGDAIHFFPPLPPLFPLFSSLVYFDLVGKVIVLFELFVTGGMMNCYVF